MSTIQIYLNGQAGTVPKDTTLQQALALLDAVPTDDIPFATALNGNHIARMQRENTLLSAGDQITTFEPITGG